MRVFCNGRRAAIAFSRVVICLLLVGAGAVLAAPPYDPPFPTPEQRRLMRKGSQPFVKPLAPSAPEQLAALANQDQYDVTRYFLDLDFTPSTHTVAGTVTITATTWPASSIRSCSTSTTTWGSPRSRAARRR